MDEAALAAQAGSLIDLERAPFTRPRSRLLVLREGDGVRVHTAEYERPLEMCRVLGPLVVRDEHGTVLPVTRVLPHVVEFGAGAATLGFAGASALTLGAGASALSAEWAIPDAGAASSAIGAGSALRFEIGPQREVRVERSGTHAADLRRGEGEWAEWFARCPRVREDLQPMTAFCWWVLGANIVELAGLGDAVVPSKIGYVGLWQWDAYFIAAGLRHGDAALARQQLELAFRFPTPAGQLPDVVHEHGVLAGSDDLPEADRANLRRSGSAVADPTSPVPLTKPPLAAWALAKVLEAEPADDWAREQLAVIRRSQDWWFAQSDLDGDGLPEYGHPYSSGLDDSPVFDGPLPVATPDLAAYLVVQDLMLADLGDRLGDGPAAPHRARAARTLASLLRSWDPVRGMFRVGASAGPDTIVGLMPLLTGRLPAEVAGRLVEALDDDGRFGAPWPVPTVAVGDPAFSPERMWRGPVWVNTNALLVEGLRASGYPDRARALAEQTVALVIHGGGPHEYYNPETGLKAASATTAFGWSAALFVDLAVGLSR